VNGGFILYGLWSVGGVGIVENGPARHIHDTSFVQIASGSALVCGFVYALRIRAFGLYVRESISNAGTRDSFGFVQLSG